MKLDYDLIRQLLLDIEERAEGFIPDTASSYRKSYPKIDEKYFLYHIKYLSESGYIKTGIDLEDIYDITPRGREYLDSIRDQGVWEEVKKKLQPFSSVPSDILVALAKDALSHLLGLHGTV